MHTLELFNLTGKVAVVTGAGSGIGAAISCALSEAGADIAALDIDRDRAQAICSEVQALGRRAVAVACDIADEQAVEAAFVSVLQVYGKIDILFNNAGIGDPDPGVIHTYDTDNWLRVVNVNLNGQFFCARAALRAMVTQGSGKIINIASMWGLTGPSSVFPLPAYAATKGAMVNLTREMALEYATSGVTVNAICPGFFRTRLGPYDENAFCEAVTAITPMGRIAEPDEMKGTAVYLASAASDFMTGAMISVDGGGLAR